MELTLTNLSLLLASSLGLFLSVLIFHKYGYSLANRLLATLLLLYSLILLRLLLWDLEYYLIIPRILLLPISISFLMGPMHFLYCKYLIGPEDRLNKKDYIHFIPFVIYLLMLIPTYFLPADELIASFREAQSETRSGEFLVFNWIITVQVLFYLIITLIRIHKFSISVKQVFSSVDKIKLNWLWYITVLIGSGMVVFLIENTLLLGGYIISEKFALSNLIFSGYVIAIGYLGMLKSEIFLSKDFSDSVHEMTEIQQDSEIKDENTKYRRSGLTEERADEIVNSLKILMIEKKPFTDSSLTLNKLAEMLGVTPHNLSEVINTKLQQNFFDFINQYRVDQVKKNLLEYSKEHYTLLGLAMEAGFNSKSSFNSIFKKNTGVTPTEFKNGKRS